MSSSNAQPPAVVSASAFLSAAPESASTSSPAEIRQLVMDYLCSCCYADSAKAFAREVESLASDSGRGAKLVTTNGSSSNGTDASAVSRAAEATNGSSNGHHAMEDVVATPPPFDADGDDAMDEDDEDDEGEAAGESDELDELEVESALRHTNGAGAKTVAIDLSEETEEVDPPEGWSMLSIPRLQSVRRRRKIREHILSGRIQSAVDLVNEFYPAILSSPTPSASASSKAATSHSHTLDTCTPMTFFTPTPSLSSSSTASSPTGSKLSFAVLGEAFQPAALSLRPEIVALNLQLQSFVEHIRTANSTSNPSTPTAADSPSEGGMSASTSSIASARTVSMTKAIRQSQDLRNSVLALREGKERDAWNQECIDVSGLMAYTDLSVCPVRGYLSQSRRDTLAEMVNAAILQHSKRTPMPVIALAARQATAIWDTLSEGKPMQFPPPLGGTSTSKSKAKAVPKFNLRTFLSEPEALVERTNS